jgi:hypothetical protein
MPEHKKLTSERCGPVKSSLSLGPTDTDSPLPEPVTVSMDADVKPPEQSDVEHNPTDSELQPDNVQEPVHSTGNEVVPVVLPTITAKRDTVNGEQAEEDATFKTNTENDLELESKAASEVEPSSVVASTLPNFEDEPASRAEPAHDEASKGSAPENKTEINMPIQDANIEPDNGVPIAAVEDVNPESKVCAPAPDAAVEDITTGLANDTGPVDEPPVPPKFFDIATSKV